VSNIKFEEESLWPGRETNMSL